jgi:hypothetical protein
MARGLSTPWKQALGFYFIHGTVKGNVLAEIIKETIVKLNGIGLNVRCTVCDQGPTNITALKLLGYTCDSPLFHHPVTQIKIHVIFDVPHLVKNVRNNLRRHDIKTDTESVISWKHIEKLYDVDSSNSIRLTHKLKKAHLNPIGQQSMRVRLATQVFSHSVAASLSTCIEAQLLLPEAIHTADFVSKMDTLFDILNSRKRYADKKQRCAIINLSTDGSLLKQLTDLQTWVKEWTFIGVKNQDKISSHWGLVSTITSVISLSQDLFADGFKFFCTARVNEDCLENFFSIIRSKCGWSDNPSSMQFIAAFKNAVVLGALETCSKSTNCEKDSDFVLLHSVANTSTDETSKSPQDAKSRPEADIQHLLIEDTEIGDIIVDKFSHTEETLIPYLAGWLAKKVVKCDGCSAILRTSSYTTSYDQSFLNHKEYVSDALFRPSDDLVKVVHEMEEQFRLHFSAAKSGPDVAKTLFSIIESACSFAFLFALHPEHAICVSRSMIAKYTVMRIHFALKFENADLSKFRSMTQRKLKILKHE